MNSAVKRVIEFCRPAGYCKRQPAILVNGLAEQPESWFRTRPYLSRHFDVQAPEILVYNGEVLRKRVEQGGEVTIDYLVDRLATYLDEFVQNPPYHFVASSLGGQVVLKYAVRHPDKVNRLVLLCPSGFYGEENLPVMDGVRRSQYDSMVQSVFHDKRFAATPLIEEIERKMRDRRWKRGLLATLRGTVGHSVSDLLSQVPHPCLVIWGGDDRILADVAGSIRAGKRLQRGLQLVIPRCGHAPQIERHRLVNKLVRLFLTNKLHTTPSAFSPSKTFGSFDEETIGEQFPATRHLSLARAILR